MKNRSALAPCVVSLLVMLAPHGPHQSLITAQTAAPLRSSISGFAESLQTITNLLDRGRGIEAENVARALLTRVESITGPDAVEVAEVLDLLGRAVRRSSKVSGEEKRAFAERAVAIKEKTLGAWHPGLAISLINLAVERTLAREPAAAKPLLERAVAIREKAFGSNHVSVGTTLETLAGVLMTVRDDDGARSLIARALRIREAHYGAEHPETIRALLKTGIFHAEISDYPGARQHYERALALSQKVLGPGHALTSDILLRLAIVLSEGFADYAGSVALNQRLVTTLEETFGPGDVRLSLPLSNLAQDLRDIGDYASARTVAERSVGITERALGPAHPAVAANLHTLATVLAANGAFGDAMRTFERATRINEDAFKPPNPEVGRALWFIPDLFPLSGYSSDDVFLFEQAAGIRERNHGLADPTTIHSLTNLAAVLASVDDYKRTRPLFERALASAASALGPDHPEVATAATNLAHVLRQVGDETAARPLYDRALRIWEQSLGPEHPRVATALVNLAHLYLSNGVDREAQSLLRRALAIQEKSLGGDHPDVAATLTDLATLAARSGSTTEALETAARAQTLWYEHMRLTARFLSERQALAYASSGASALDVMLSVASERPSDRQTSTMAWTAVIRARGMILDEMAARHRVATETEDQEVAALANTLSTARQRLAAAWVRGIGNDPAERYRRLLDQARSDKERAERNFAERSVTFRQEQSRSRLDLTELSAALPPGSALVSFVRYRRGTQADSYLAFVVPGAHSGAVLVPLGSASTVDNLVAQWKRQLDQEAMAGGRSAQRSEIAYRRVAGNLRRTVWDPLTRHLSNATRVFIVPDGALHLVSFAALPSVSSSRYLVEAGPSIHYLSTERDLLFVGGEQVQGGGVLALGGAAFDQPAYAPVASPSSFRSTRSACADFQSMRFDPLPASLKEVDAVVALWNESTREAGGRPGGVPPLRLSGTAASESAFKAAAAGRRILHLATHGFFLGDRCASALDRIPGEAAAGAKIVRENPLLLSGLVLSGANQRDAAGANEDDGILTAEEVTALNLNGVEWAVLSGCDTGVGSVTAGEGVFGLRRAFQIAGARTVIMSLWPVDDPMARQWMAALYESRLMKKRSTADAVNEASRRVLLLRRSRGLNTHPFHWAAFVAAGDWR